MYMYIHAVGAMYKAEEAVQVAQEALNDATDRHKTLFQSLRELMDRAVELGLKSKVRGANSPLNM